MNEELPHEDSEAPRQDSGDSQDVVVDDARSREIFGLGFSGAAHFAEMLADQGEIRGLIGPREIPRLWTRHVVNSAAVAQFLPRTGSIADVGSGAGLPGIVIALMRPDMDVHLIEPMQRRVEWLDEVIEELDLDNVEVHRGRAEEFHGGLKVDVVTARAVAALKKLVPMCVPLLRGGGVLLAQKGQRAADEVAAAAKVLQKAKMGEVTIHEVDMAGDGEITRVVEAHKKQ